MSEKIQVKLNNYNHEEEDKPMLSAVFHEKKLANYSYCVCFLYSCMCFPFTVLIWPIWAIIGKSYSKLYVDRLSIEVNKRAIVKKSGPLFCNCYPKKTKTILLDRI